MELGETYEGLELVADTQTVSANYSTILCLGVLSTVWEFYRNDLTSVLIRLIIVSGV